MIHILIRYLGIKTKLLNVINDEVSRVTPEGGTVLDMFAGSTIVGQSLMNDYVVYSNDIQNYSYTVGKSTIEIDDEFDYTKLDYRKVINSDFYRKNLKILESIFNKPLKYEKNLFFRLLNENDNKELLIEFKNYYDNTPYTGHYNRASVNKYFLGMKHVYTEDYYKKVKNSKNEFYGLFSLIYACPYFSLQQAIFIDSFRFAIDKLFENKAICFAEYNAYLSMVIYILQNIVTSVGDHFAQPEKMKIDDEIKFKKEIKKVIQKKTLNLDEYLEKIQMEFREMKPTRFSKDNLMFGLDYKKLFNNENEKIMEKIDTIYIDPPYTNAHYSRFYHILETLVNYDYPTIKYFGRYRDDRYQSPFCLKSEAKREFDKMIQLCADRNKNIIISYSDTIQCILSKEEIKDICEKYYVKVTESSIAYLYRNLGQKPNKVKGNELLFTCEAN